jgi:hypothetical protein
MGVKWNLSHFTFQKKNRKLWGQDSVRWILSNSWLRLTDKTSKETNQKLKTSIKASLGNPLYTCSSVLEIL